MEGMRGKFVSNDGDKDGGSLKIILPQKPHRRLLSGLKLFKTMKAKTGNSASDNKGEDEEASELQHLPLDLITHHILAKMSIKTLLQFKSISKEWYSTISSNEFANMHLKFSLSHYHPSSPIECLFIQAENNFYLFYYKEDDQKLDYHFVKLETSFDDQLDEDAFHLVGSCNGLICLANSSSATIWNPFTHLWCKVSDPHPLSFNCRNSWGFGYVSSVDDYKVVRLVQNFSTMKIFAHVFSLRTRKWKRVHDHGLDHNVSLTKTDPGVLVDETLYWLMDTNGVLKRKISVMGFSLALEKFETTSGLVPRSVTPWNHFLCVMGGRLALCGLNVHEDVYISNLKRPGEAESICLSPNLDSRLWTGLVGFTMTDKFFIISKNGELALIDPNSKPKQHIPLINFREGRRPGMVSYIPSLISPFAISELKRD